MPAAHAGANTRLGHEPLHGLEEIGVHAKQAIDAGQLRVGRAGGVAVVADEGADEGTILLLDVRAVVLAVGPTAGKHDALPPAVVVDGAIDELGAVVTVQPAQGDGQAAADLVQGGLDALVVLAPDRVEFDPAGGDIDGAQGMQKEAAAVVAAVSDEIDLEKPGLGLVPVGKGPDGAGA